MAGKLYIIPNFLAKTDASAVFPQINLEIIRGLNYFIVENPKPARALLKAAGKPTPFEGLHFIEMDKHHKQDTGKMIQPLLEGYDMGLVTDAGYPVVADPGENIVALAQEKGIKVKPLIGPSSILLALAASGLNAEQFVFHAYLPIPKTERRQSINDIEKDILKTGYSHIFIETPYRNEKLLNDLVQTCHQNIKLCIALDITSENELIITRSLKDWKLSEKQIHKKPAIFILGT